MQLPFFKELQALKPWDMDIFPQETLEVSFIVPAKKAGPALKKSVATIHSFLKTRFAHSFEIILVPNPNPEDSHDLSTSIAQAIAQELDHIRVFPHAEPRGKGAAVRTGLAHAHGKWIFLTDADLPYDLEFFDQAMEKLKSGAGLVSGNRRLTTSFFHVPVRLLPLAYGRHRLGLGFNFCVRKILKLRTTDTQAGIKALSRNLVRDLLNRQSCPGFLFDLEIFLTARGQGYQQFDLPVTLHLNDEKSTVRILKECVLVAFWITRILWRDHKKIYGSKSLAL